MHFSSRSRLCTRPAARAWLRLLPVPLAAALPLRLPAQSTPTPPPAAAEPAVVLTPFEVRSEPDRGYAVTSTLAGSRLNTELKDVAAQIQIMTPELLADIGTVSVEDAFRYSINVENVGEYSATANGDFNGRVINPNSDNRMRGLTSSGRTHDFFETSLFLDAYNTDRITYSSGPNAILFGTGKPAGIVDVSFNRARLDRTAYTVQFRADNYDSLRTSLDVEQPILPGKLAVRLDALQQNQNGFRTYSGDDTRRLFGTLTFKPFRTTSLRVWAEQARIDATQARNTVFTDRVTPWVAAGRPLFNNGTAAAGALASPGAGDPLFSRYTVTRGVYVFGATSGAVAPIVWGSAASTNPLANAAARYSVATKGPGDLAAAPDNYPYSLADSTVFPWSANIHGNGTRNLMRGRILGATLEQRIGANLFLEASFNRERNRNDFTDVVRGTANSLYADANRFLPDRVTPNPNAGRYFFEGAGRGGIRRFTRDEVRTTLAYDLDLRRHRSWLGRHRFGALAQRSFQVDGQQDSDLRIVPDGVNPVDAWSNTTHAMQWRAYVSDPRAAATGQVFYVNLPFDPLKGGKVPGYTVHAPDNPIGATTRATNLKSSTLYGQALSVQSFLLRERLVTTFGVRRDRVTNWSAIDEPEVLGRLGAGGANSAWLPIMDTRIGTASQRFTRGDTYSAGGVFHATPALSVFFNRSTGWNAAPGTRYPDGSYLAGSKGLGTDYGVRLDLFAQRLSLRVNRYNNTSGPDGSAFRALIRNPVNDIELILENAREAGLANPPPSPFVTGAVATYEVTSMAEARGYEFELTANPTPNWRLTLNGSKGKSIESQIGAPWLAYINSRLKTWSDHASLTDPESTSTTTVRDLFRNLVNDLNLMKQADGRASEQSRGTRVNFIGRYTLAEGRLKGLFAGAGHRWRTKSVVGYKTQVLDNAFPFAGLPDKIAVPDINSPIHGRAINETELFVGYARKFGRRFLWRGQLNVRNVFDEDGRIAQRASSVGATTVFTLPEPRTFVFTNTFSF